MEVGRTHDAASGFGGVWLGLTTSRTSTPPQDGQELVAQQREDAVLAVHPGARGKPRIALITASGTIVQGPVKPGAAPPAQKLIDATGLAAELEKLEKDPMVGAMGRLGVNNGVGCGSGSMVGRL